MYIKIRKAEISNAVPESRKKKPETNKMLTATATMVDVSHTQFTTENETITKLLRNQKYK